MYNRYIPGSGQVRREEDPREQSKPGGGAGIFGAGQQLLRQLGESLHLFGDGTKNAGVAGILREFGLGELDSGDILLLLILLLVFLEGNNTELVITLALLFLLGEDDAQKE